jgi:hypothetical protein
MRSRFGKGTGMTSEMRCGRGRAATDDALWLLDVKNSKPPRRSYERYVLVIHTAEYLLDSGTVERFLKGARFNTSLVTDAFLGLSYEPGKGYPVFELELVRA